MQSLQFVLLLPPVQSLQFVLFDSLVHEVQDVQLEQDVQSVACVSAMEVRVTVRK